MWELLLKSCNAVAGRVWASTWNWVYFEYQVLQLLNVLDFVCKTVFLPTTKLSLVRKDKSWRIHFCFVHDFITWKKITNSIFENKNSVFNAIQYSHIYLFTNSMNPWMSFDLKMIDWQLPIAMRVWRYDVRLGFLIGCSLPTTILVKC